MFFYHNIETALALRAAMCQGKALKINVNLVRDFWEPLLLLRVLYLRTLYSSLTLLISNKLAVNTQSGVTRRVLPLYTHTLPFCVSQLIHSKLARCLDLPSSGMH